MPITVLPDMVRHPSKYYLTGTPEYNMLMTLKDGPVKGGDNEKE